MESFIGAGGASIPCNVRSVSVVPGSANTTKTEHRQRVTR